ncbi:MAG: hypothetical protein ABIO70_31965 [Pseudomonadota bacterium]
MLTHLLAVLGLGLACGLWVILQRWVAKRDPGQPGVEGSVGCSHGECEQPDGACAGCSLKGECSGR